MTHKLTDEQVNSLRFLNADSGYKVIYIEKHPMAKEERIYITKDSMAKEERIYITKDSEADGYRFKVEHPIPGKSSVLVRYETGDDYLDKVVEHIEHLLNQRYCWLPKNNGWIMSGEVYNLTNAGKVLELICIGEANYWNELEDPWYCVGDGDMQAGYMTPQEFKQGIAIPAESPIWDAVKGVE